jgi:polysaccharide biosynthesis/export protein
MLNFACIRDLMLFGFFLCVLIGGCKTTPVHNISNPEQSYDSENALNSGPYKEPAYIVGVGDVFDLKILYHPEYDITVTVPPDEIISLPRVHGYSVSGKTITLIESDLTKKLSTVLANPDITINLKTYSPQKILVLGKVKQPGLYPYTRNLTLPQAIALAGGVEETGRGDDIIIIPNINGAKPFKISFTPEKGTAMNLPVINPGDIIIVPAKKIHKVDTFISQFFEKVNPALSFYLNMLDIKYYKDTYRVR